MNHELKNQLADLYLEFINDFLTTERFAEYLDISSTQCRALVDLGREFHNERVSE